jgi:hypothetical protein
LVFTLIVIAMVVLPPLLTAATDLARRPGDLPLGQHGLLVSAGMARQMSRELFALASLPYDAVMSVEAIARTTWRVLVSKRNLLEWRTASDAQRTARTDLGGFYLSMWVLPVTAILVTLGLVVLHPQALAAAGALISLWFVSPAIAWWFSRPTLETRPALSAAGRGVPAIRRTADWRFFEVFVGPADNYLPPDNYQEDPPVGAAIARRRPISACRCCRTWPRTTSATSRPGRSWRGRRGRWRASIASSAIADTCSTGTTRARWSRFVLTTSRPWTAETSPATC